MYHVATTASGTAVQGRLPLTAEEALAYLARTRDNPAGIRPVEIRNEQGRKVTLRRLRKEACS